MFFLRPGVFQYIIIEHLWKLKICYLSSIIACLFPPPRGHHDYTKKGQDENKPIAINIVINKTDDFLVTRPHPCTTNNPSWRRGWEGAGWGGGWRSNRGSLWTRQTPARHQNPVRRKTSLPDLLSIFPPWLPTMTFSFHEPLSREIDGGRKIDVAIEILIFLEMLQALISEGHSSSPLGSLSPAPERSGMRFKLGWNPAGHRKKRRDPFNLILTRNEISSPMKRDWKVSFFSFLILKIQFGPSYFPLLAFLPAAHTHKEKKNRRKTPSDKQIKPWMKFLPAQSFHSVCRSSKALQKLILWSRDSSAILHPSPPPRLVVSNMQVVTPLIPVLLSLISPHQQLQLCSLAPARLAVSGQRSRHR